MPGCQHREVRLYMAKPLSTMSLAFFSPSFANCVRLGLFTSAYLHVGWPPTLFGTYLTLGSCTTGLGLPATGSMPPAEFHPKPPCMKSGGAESAAAHAAPVTIRAASMPPV